MTEAASVNPVAKGVLAFVNEFSDQFKLLDIDQQTNLINANSIDIDEAQNNDQGLKELIKDAFTTFDIKLQDISVFKCDVQTHISSIDANLQAIISRLSETFFEVQLEILNNTKYIVGTFQNNFMTPERFRSKYFSNRNRIVRNVGKGLAQLSDETWHLLQTPLIGRDTEKQELIHFLKNPYEKWYLLYGEPGCGKTYLMLHLSEWAQSERYSVLFVDEKAIQNLNDAVISWNYENPLLLIWDDCRSENKEAIKEFLSLPERSDKQVKCVINTWLIYRKIIDLGKPHDANIVESILQPLKDETAYNEYAQHLYECIHNVNPSIQFKDLLYVIKLAQGNPQISLVGLHLLLQDISIDLLPSEHSILHVYVESITRELQKLDLQEMYIVLALIEYIPSKWLDKESTNDRFPELKQKLKKLIANGFIEYINNEYILKPDVFRMAICHELFSNDTPLFKIVLQDLPELLKPFIPLGLSKIWLSLEQAYSCSPAVVIEIKTILLKKTLQILNNATMNKSFYNSLCTIFFYLSSVERDSDLILLILECLTELTKGNITGEPAIALTAALTNVTAQINSPTDCHDVSEKVRKIADRHNPRVVEIDANLSLALANVSARLNDQTESMLVVEEIEKIANYYSPRVAEIDSVWAHALYNMTALFNGLALNKQIAKKIGKISAYYNTHIEGIDTALSKTLYNLSVRTKKSADKLNIANVIKMIADSYPMRVSGIDFEWAKILVNISARISDPVEAHLLADEIGKIADLYEPRDKNIDLIWTMSLYNVAKEYHKPKEIRCIADEIKVISGYYNPRVAELDIELAKALGHVTLNLNDPNEIKPITEEIESISNYYSRRIAKIDTVLAITLCELMEKDTDQSNLRQLANRIRNIATYYNPRIKEIDIEWANALANVAYNLIDSNELQNVIEAIVQISEHYSHRLSEIDSFLADTLVHKSATQVDQIKKKEISYEIKKIADSYNPRVPEIDEALVKSLYNIIAILKDPIESSQLVNEIGRISDIHKPRLPIIDAVWFVSLYLVYERNKESVILPKLYKIFQMRGYSLNTKGEQKDFIKSVNSITESL